MPNPAVERGATQACFTRLVAHPRSSQQSFGHSGAESLSWPADSTHAWAFTAHLFTAIPPRPCGAK